MALALNVKLLSGDDKSTFLQVMAWCWCLQATSHYLSHCWPRSMLSYGVTGPQWVKNIIICILPFRQQFHILYKWDLNISTLLTHLPLVPHICASKLGQHWFRGWLAAYSAPSHYLNQCRLIVNWILRNKLQGNLNQNTKFFIHENASENFVCKIAAIFSRGRGVDGTINKHITDHKVLHVFHKCF